MKAMDPQSDKTASLNGALVGGGLGGLYGLLSPVPDDGGDGSDTQRRLLRGLGYGALGALGGHMLVPRGPKAMHDIAPWMKDVARKADAKKAYRAAARAAHPDVGGSHRVMQDLNAAWEQIQNHPDFAKLGHVNKAYAAGRLSALRAFVR